MVDTTTKTNKLLTDLIPDIHKNMQLMQEITAGGNEQLHDIEHITESMQDFKDGSQETIIVSERLSDSSKNLTEQYQQLNEALRYFK
jgi:methyl-accepting chemotaxis protein